LHVKQAPTNEGKATSGKFPTPPDKNTQQKQTQSSETQLNNPRLGNVPMIRPAQRQMPADNNALSLLATIAALGAVFITNPSNISKRVSS
jgi:hypothetical protein